MPASVTVLTAKTLLLAESTAARILREGDTTSNAGDVPELNGAIGAMVSFKPLTNTSAPKSVVEVTPWEAMTRWCKPLAPCRLELEYLLHPFKLKLAQTPSRRKAIALFREIG